MKLELVDPFSSRVATAWRALEERARPSYFLTWGWIENWLACLPTQEAPQLAILTGDAGPVAACFLAKRRVLRHGFVPSRALYINYTGLDAYDDLCVEHNTLLAVPDGGASIATSCSFPPPTPRR